MSCNDLLTAWERPLSKHAIYTEILYSLKWSRINAFNYSEITHVEYKCIILMYLFCQLRFHSDVSLSIRRNTRYTCLVHCWSWLFNSLRPRQYRRHFADDIFKCIFLNENVWISLKISLKFIPEVRINNTPALVQIMAWRRPGDKPLPEPMMVSLLMHLCVTRPQWVNGLLDTRLRNWEWISYI